MDRILFRRCFLCLSLLGAAPVALHAQVGPSTPTRQVAPYRTGDAVQIEWRGTWYPGRILDVGADGHKIRYDGYDAKWDEWVAPARLRRPGDNGGSQESSPSPERGAGASGAALAGTWYLTQAAGQITIARDGSYTSSTGARGTVRVAGDQLTFTGPLAAWNGGRASLNKGNIEFYWKNADGSINWFTFIRG